MWSRFKIFGHPVHPMVVAYPIALYTATLVGFVLFGATDDAFWLKLAIATNVAGVVMAAVAALPGFVDWLFIPKGTLAKRTGWIHMLLNVGSLALFAISMFAYLGKWDDASDASAGLGIALTAGGVALTVAAGFQGWKLIQDHHVGVNLTPEQERIDKSREMRAADQAS